MELTPEQHEKLISHINEKWKPPFECACCKANSWSIGKQVFQIAEFFSGGLRVGGPVLPLAAVTCENCGNTVLINALLAGVIAPAEEHPAREEGQ